MGKFTKLFSLVLFIVTLKSVLASLVDDEKCDEQLADFIEALQEKKFWALNLIDSWGKINSGILSGNLNSPGSIDQCTNFTTATKLSGKIVGQYCYITYTASGASVLEGFPSTVPTSALRVSSGVCIPATCSSEKVLEFLNLNLPGSLKASRAKCTTKDPIPLDNFDVAAIAMLSVAVALIILSTTFDLVSRKNKDAKQNKILTSFSAYTNGKRLFEVKREENSRSIACLEGLRSITMLFVIFAHRYLELSKLPLTNVMDLLDLIKHYYSIPFLWESLCVDTFLLIGGFLGTLVALNAFKKKTFNTFNWIVKRYFRYTPTLVAATICYISVFRHISSPLASSNERENCERHWWSWLLHVQNYVNPTEICGAQCWYLSLDFHMFLMTPPLVYLAMKYGSKWVCALAALALSSCLYVWKIAYDNEFFFKDFQSDDQFIKIVQPTHSRISPWIIGIILGLIDARTTGKQIKINKMLSALVWLFTIGLISVVLFLHHPLYQLEDNQTSLMFNSLFIGFYRSVWSIAVAWIIFACHKLQTGGFIRWFLSLPEWQPIGRLSLSMYITSEFYQAASLSYLKEASTFRIWSVISGFMGDAVAITFIATFFCLAFEMPIFTIVNFVCNSRIKKEPKDQAKKEVPDLYKVKHCGLDNPAFVTVDSVK